MSFILGHVHVVLNIVSEEGVDEVWCFDLLFLCVEDISVVCGQLGYLLLRYCCFVYLDLLYVLGVGVAEVVVGPM